MLQNLKKVPFEDSEPAPKSNKFEPIKDGEYQFEIVEADEDVTSGGFTVIKFKAIILGPEFAGRSVFHRLIVAHEDPAKQKAVSIGLGQLKTLCDANKKTGWPSFAHEIENWRFNAKLDYREYNGKWYEDLKFLSPYGKTSGVYGISQGYKAKMATAPMPKSTSFNDDDIPF